MLVLHQPVVTAFQTGPVAASEFLYQTKQQGTQWEQKSRSLRSCISSSAVALAFWDSWLFGDLVTFWICLLLVYTFANSSFGCYKPYMHPLGLFESYFLPHLVFCMGSCCVWLSWNKGIHTMFLCFAWPRSLRLVMALMLQYNLHITVHNWCWLAGRRGQPFGYKHAPHCTDSPKSLLAEHSSPWMHQMFCLQGVSTKGACGNSLNNQCLFLAMAVTVADEVYMTPRPSIFLNRGDAVSTGWGCFFFLPLLSTVPAACQWLSLSQLEPTASHPALVSPGGWHFLGKSVPLRRCAPWGRKSTGNCCVLQIVL